MALEEIRKAKLEKLKRIRESGVNPYPSKSARSHTIAQILERFGELEKSGEKVTFAGRVMALREHGGSVFLDIEDETAKIQSYFKKDSIGAKEFDFFIETIDIGDFLEIRGFLFKTKKGEQTVETEEYRILAKSLLPLPEKWHGLQDKEERYRKRYLDLIFNKDVKKKFELRSKIIQELRSMFLKDGFLEVETPVLQPLPGGANARPFKTHMHYMDLELYLRVAPELYLKRLLVGGFERVFEIGRNFRNEGIDKEHNPEFTMLEAYAAYKDYVWMMDFIENTIRNLVKNIFNSHEVEIGKNKVDFSHKFKRVKFDDLLEKYAGVRYHEASEKELEKKARESGITIEKRMSKGVIADEIYKKTVRPDIIQPTFVIDHPLEISPLAKKIEGDPNHVERFQLLVGGMEVVNAFSELNDPIDQKERFEEQEKIRKKGDEEAQRMDEDFIEALEHGMPPAAGVGIGVDRLVALLTDSHSLREVLLFPTMKPK